MEKTKFIADLWSETHQVKALLLWCYYIKTDMATLAWIQLLIGHLEIFNFEIVATTGSYI